jgi:nucleoid-associated protein EbfC
MNMREVQKMQQKLAKLQEDLANTLFNGTSGGGAVTITMNGKSELSAIKIDPEAFDPEDIAELEFMIMAAAKDAQNKVTEAQERMYMSITGGVKIPGLL